MSMWVVIAFIVGLIPGLLVAWYYRRQRIGQHEAQVQRLLASLDKKGQDLQSHRASLQVQKLNIEQLQGQVHQSEETIRHLNAQLDERKLTISWLEGTVSERDAQIHDLKTRVKEAQFRAKGLMTSLNEKELSMQVFQAHVREQEANIARLRSQLTQSKDTIRELNAQLGERNKNIVQLKSVVSERDDQIQAFKSRPREAEARAEGPEALLKGNGQDAKPVAETDNLRRIEGIGPKISQVLYNAGITTFAQLATVDLSLVHQALLDAGIRLADPTTWPEQARLATAGDWKSLQALQGELKGGRRV